MRLLFGGIIHKMTKAELLSKLQFLFDAEETKLTEDKYYSTDFSIKNKELNIESPKLVVKGTNWGYMTSKYKYPNNDLTGDTEMIHVTADELLLEYINDPDIKEAFNKIRKWYA